MNDTKISQRQHQIILILQKNSQGLNRSELELLLVDQDIEVSKVTLIRDLNELIELKQIFTTGIGKSTKYLIKTHPLLSYLDIDSHFFKDVDQREGQESFNFSIFKDLNNIFTKDELVSLDKLNEKYKNNIKSITPDIYKKELERFVIELSWKSSKIEGNTYTLLETEQLIRESKKAEGKTQAEAQMILNHKQAFDVIVKNENSFKKLNKQDIIDVHAVLVKDLGVTKGFRKYKVGITGTNYLPIDNQWQIEAVIKKLTEVINITKHPLEKALIIIAMLSYIQAFNDGNKRTARLVGNAILIANGYAPLSYRNINELEFKKALLVFYEQNNLSYFKKLFINQFEFVVDNYFESSS
jgi:Fic family protein